jgi:drug/metabolite transporter (DMT)-like permease
MILGGVYLAAFAKRLTRRGSPAQEPVPIKKWLFLALGAGLCWTTSFSFMKFVLTEVDAIIAQTFRLPIAALILTTISLQAGERKKLRIREYKRKTLLLIVVCGILSYGMGVVLELYAMKFAGMAKAAVLTSWTPLFILFLSAFLLKERITLRLILGTLLCSGGTVVLMVL